ncbi:hypothetical protein [Oceanobacter sp. 4_MG-2023]|uniref:hypothetical protein n=1 Tax=Oceanobacter sp. 4_MG-2023 TaxID=3062623 RepID=UPI00273327B7|nr:hypothetical protein [Oceanobacter sp. 4_MG-2023]MDP2548506.1 hypothetical protein [Oceanobacter sp. 4_MG-2023]
MQLNRCPVCHSRIGLEQLVQDDAGRELLALLAAHDADTATALVGYLGLFRSGSRDLAMDRALRLVKEALALAEPDWLTPALQDTVESIRAKRQNTDAKALTNHNYLKRVLESVISSGTQRVRYQRPAAADYQTTAASMQRLTDTSW